MNVEDEGAFGILNKFVNCFFPSRWVTRDGDDILGEDGEPTSEAHPINTKALVEFHTYGDVATLLGLCPWDFIAFCF